jgi:hypothetical protein
MTTTDVDENYNTVVLGPLFSERNLLISFYTGTSYFSISSSHGCFAAYNK